MISSKRAKRAKREVSSPDIASPHNERAIVHEKLVESVNSLSATDFLKKYVSADRTLIPYVERLGLTWHYGDAARLQKEVLTGCLELIELTSRVDYEASEMKWSVTKKSREMRLPDLKYFILSNQDTCVAGFVSFMVTYEDGHEVVYIYEIHLIPAWQGQGLGKWLLDAVEEIARNVGVSKVMLTVFRANVRAVGWYIKLGYQEDEFSPGPRKLRNGSIKQPSYIILSKQLKS